MDAPDRLMLLWAKTGKDRGQYHPLICHMLDVAAVAHAMWQDVVAPAGRARLASSLALDEEDAGRWVGLWAGLHDTGKASPAFALQDAAARERLAQAGFVCRQGVPATPHGIIGERVLPDLLASLGISPDLARQVASVLGGHHGAFPAAGQVVSVDPLALGGRSWAAARQDLVSTMASLFLEGAGEPRGTLDNAAVMYLAGLVSVADWIGSAERFFPYCVQGSAMSRVVPANYAETARRNARGALAALGWANWAGIAEPRTFAALFPAIPGPPFPVQARAIDLADHFKGPALVLIEAPMGEGKTEAAMYLADRWGTTLSQRGCYFALPTQATSNQMFSRVHSFLAQRYPEETVNIQLLHGHAALSAEFQVLRQRADSLLVPGDVHARPGSDGAAAGVIAAEWFTHRKRGLLAPFGVGTVDQALLGALQTRHVFVRLFGLGHKTVIVDEAHAYEVYTTRLLERLLEWLATLGSPVVLLSATLPAERRKSLVEAYARGLNPEAPAPSIPEQRYPRLTWFSAEGAGAEHVPADPRRRKAVKIKWLDGQPPAQAGEDYPLGDALQKALAKGGCAVVVCNTVRRAQAVYRALKPYFPGTADDGWPELDLFHARFLFAERDAREKRALLRFGKEGATVETAEGRTESVDRPFRAVLVATQVVEQSLDVDFDLMVSEVAPIDLLLQRMGRLWRHARTRPTPLALPTVWLVKPEAVVDGVPNLGPGTERVYDRHVLLRTWLEVKDREEVRLPDDMEDLVEAVYGERSCPFAPGEPLAEHWQKTRQESEAKVVQETREAAQRWLRKPSYRGEIWELCQEPREEDAPDFHVAHQALTRLAEPSVSIVCLYGDEARPSFDREGRDALDPRARPDLALAARLLGRSVQVADRRALEALLARQVPSGWRDCALLRHHHLVTLDAAGGADLDRWRLLLDPEVGLEIVDRT